MNHASNNRRNVIRTILLCFAIAFMGTVFVTQGDAAPANGTIKSRVTAQRELWEAGDGQLQVKNQYKANGPFKTLVQSTTKCVGGSTNGYTCVNTRTETNCSQARTEATVPVWANVDAPLDPITADQPFATPQDFQPFELVASPVPADGG